MTAALRADPVARLATLAPTISVGILTADLKALGTDLARLGQRFIPATMGRLERARRRLDAAGRRIVLGVDGGITRENVGQFAGMGVDLVVTGSAVFDGKAPADNARHMLAALGAR